MAYHYATQHKNEHTAHAVGKNLNVSLKQAVEICSHLRFRSLGDAKKRLGRVIALQEAIPVKRYNWDLGHKKGIGPGSYHVKASKAILSVLESVEANAQFKGLNTAQLWIVHLCSHQAGTPRHYGRNGGREMKRSHVEIVVEEKKEEKKEQKKARKQEKKVDKQ